MALLCGGPSLERGISLNSARSVMDHLQNENITIHPFYFDQKREAYVLSPAQLYSNTPADFDFKLSQTSAPLTDEELEKELKSCDIVFPVMHGAFGEDGTIQKWLEDRSIPFVGSSYRACKQAFDKYTANEFIKSKGFFALPSCVVKIYKDEENKKIIEDFFKEHKIQRAIVKPAAGGSSIGVFSVSNEQEAIEKVDGIFSKRMDTRVVIEPFVEGREFTVIILESRYGLPVAILPTEMEIDYSEHQVFDFRKKYLPTRQVTYHCPPRFDDKIIQRIQLQAEQLFTLLNIHDFSRFDGWVLDDGSIWFSDFNPISGMEQNSFLFQQSTRVGLSHHDVLKHILARSCDMQDVKHELSYDTTVSAEDNRKELPILMGGSSSERQVSLMSGTNVWLKLRNSTKYKPVPYLIDLNGGVWQVPYQLLLNHTVEEIIDNCRQASLHEEKIGRFVSLAREKLGLYEDISNTEFGRPKHFTLEDILDNHDQIFLALHGDMGEDGTIQAMLEERNITFNGPGSEASKLCMDKQATSDLVDELHIGGVYSIKGITKTFEELTAAVSTNAEKLWNEITTDLISTSVIAKPSADGCSSGVVHIHNSEDLTTYISLLGRNTGYIPAGTFKGQADRIELPLIVPEAIRFEKFIETDIIRIKGGQLKHTPKTNLVEITIGVVQDNKKMRALQPSVTVADGQVLSVEEKFQGGTGVNLTPPPPELMSIEVREGVRKKIEQLSEAIGITGYSRIDAFVDYKTGDVHIIEVNTLPALTPSTVIFQQALADDTPMYPLEFLELIANNKS